MGVQVTPSALAYTTPASPAATQKAATVAAEGMVVVQLVEKATVLRFCVMLVACAVQVTPSPEVSTVPPCPTAISMAPLNANPVRLVLASDVLLLMVAAVQVTPSGL